MTRLRMTTSLALGTLLALAISSTGLAQDMMGGGNAFGAALSPQSEVPPNDTAGVGAFSMLLSSDGNTLYYSLEVSGASSPIGAAHVHLGPAGANGPVVANFCGAGSTPACGAEGVIATGSVTAADLVGPLAGHPLGDLVTALGNGNAYANAHTANNPGGEMRGQIGTAGGG